MFSPEGKPIVVTGGSRIPIGLRTYRHHQHKGIEV